VTVIIVEHGLLGPPHPDEVVVGGVGGGVTVTDVEHGLFGPPHPDDVVVGGWGGCVTVTGDEHPPPQPDDVGGLNVVVVVVEVA
jgi:hypothetical protein